MFNRGFDMLTHGYGWLTAKLVRIAVLMLVVYAGVIAFGLNEFRKTPIGFIPQLDRGYLIIVAQLPPAASLARTDEVNRKAVEIALSVPGIAHAVNIVGFSGATFTNAPNAGAIFVTLDPIREARERPATIGRRDPGAVVPAAVGDPRRPDVRRCAAAGARHRQCRRLPHDGRGSRRPRLAGLAGRSLRDDGAGGADARPAAGLLAVREFDAAALSRHRPHQGAAARHQRAGRVRRAADLSRLGLCQRLQPVRPHLPRGGAGAQRKPQRSKRRAEDPRAQQQWRDRAARRFHHRAHITGPYRVPRYNLYPAAELDGAAAPGYSQGQAIKIMEQLAAQTLPQGFSYEWTTLAFQQIRAGNTAMFAFVLAVVFVFLVLAAQFESLTLPLAVILIVPMCLIASIVGVVLRGQDNNILTQVGFIVLIGLAAKNAILIVEFAKQLEDGGRDRFEAAVEAARLAAAADPDDVARLHSRRDAAGLGGRRRRRTAAGARHRRVLRHDRRHHLRPDLHAGVLRGDRAGSRCTFRPAASSSSPPDSSDHDIRRPPMAMKFGFGQALTRKEDDPLMRGAGRYVADVAPANSLHAVVLRSPHAHAVFASADLRACGRCRACVWC